GEAFEIVALDGMPLGYHDPKHPTRAADHLLIAPAGRLEAIVTGPPSGTHRALRTVCVDTGPDGDPNPAMILADLVQPSSDEYDPDHSNQDHSRPDHFNPDHSSPHHSSPHLGLDHVHASDGRRAVYKPVNVETLKKAEPDFTVIFTEDKNGFYINGQKYAPDARPMTSVR